MNANSSAIRYFFGAKLLVVLSIFCASPLVFSQSSEAQSSTCGPLRSQGQYGPFDFRTDLDKLPLVLTAHFTPEVEALIRGTTSGRPGGDIDYTLRAIPNNPRALMSMMLLGEKEKTTQPSGSRYTVECWFDRAIRFRPDDSVVRMVYTMFLTKNNRKPEAMQQLDSVLGTAKDNPFTYFNVGLLYLDMQEPGKALVQAHKAMGLGLPRTELRDKLKAMGKWEEPVTEAPADVSADPSAAASAPKTP